MIIPVIGAHNTGKTTLLTDMQMQGVNILPEIARVHREHIDDRYALQCAIFAAELERYQAYSMQDEVYVGDRSVFDNLAYFVYFAKALSMREWQKTILQFRVIASKCEYPVIMYTRPCARSTQGKVGVSPWIIDQAIMSVLRACKPTCDIVVLPDDRDERLRMALGVLDAVQERCA